LVMGSANVKLPVQLVKRLAGGLGYPAGCALDRPHNLVSKALIRELVVAGYASYAFFELSCQGPARSVNALFRTPGRGSGRSVFNIVIAGRVLRTRLVEQHVSSDTCTDTSDNPRKGFHSRISFMLGCALRGRCNGNSHWDLSQGGNRGEQKNNDR
jgi:hypothetical protein